MELVTVSGGLLSNSLLSLLIFFFPNQYRGDYFFAIIISVTHNFPILFLLMLANFTDSV